MEKVGKESANKNLKAALELIGKKAFDMECVCLTENGLYMGYRDYTDTVVCRAKKGEVEIDEEDVLIMFDDEEYYTPDMENLWDGRIFKAGKMIDGSLRFTPKDMVKGFFAKYEGVIRRHNNLILEERAKKAAKKAEDKRIQDQAALDMFAQLDEERNTRVAI